MHDNEREWVFDEPYFISDSISFLQESLTSIYLSIL